MDLSASRRGFLSGGIALGAMSLFARPARAIPDPRYFETALSNGLRIVVYRDNRIPLVSHTLWYRVGAGDEQMGRTGLAHFFEHLMFKGTANNPGATFTRFVDRFGGYQNAFTDFDTTCYVQRLPKEHLLDLMRLEADRMANLQLTENDIATELGAVLEEMRGTQTSVYRRFSNALRQIQYPGHRLGVSVLGTEADLRAMGREALLSFYRTYYAPNDAVLIVGGDVDPDAVVALAEKTYGQAAASPDLPVRKRAPLPAPAQTFFRQASPEVARSMVSTTYRLPGLTDIPVADLAALYMLPALSNGTGYRNGAYRRLVQQDRVATDVYGSFSIGLSACDLSFGFQAAADVGEARAVRILEDTTAILRTHLPSDSTLADAKTRYIANDVRADESAQAVVQGMGTMLLRGASLATFTGFRSRVEAMTRNDLYRVQDTYMRPENAVTSVLAPQA